MDAMPNSPMSVGYSSSIEGDSDETARLLSDYRGEDTESECSDATLVSPPMKLKEAWLQSATGSRWSFFLFNFYSFLFISANIQVNSYSTSANFDLETGSFGEFLRQARIPFLVLFGVATFIANYVSKVNYVVRPHSALHLDPAPPGKLAAIKKALVNQFFWHGPEEQFYLNARRALLSAKIFDNHHVVLYAGQKPPFFSDSDRYQKTIELLSSECIVPIVSNLDNLFTSEGAIEKRKIALVSCELSISEKMAITIHTPLLCKLKHIVFYRHNWLGRIWHDFKRKPFLKGVQTASMSLLALINWTVSKGVPGLVVLLTIFMAGYKNDLGIMSSYFSRTALFFINVAQAWLGKMLINNILKGEEAYIELRKLAMRFTHNTWPRWHFNHWVGVIATGFVFFTMVFPNAVVTPEFYATEAPIIFLQEMSACLLQPLFNITAVVPDLVMRIFVYASIWTNVWMNIPTGWMASYKKGGSLLSSIVKKTTARLSGTQDTKKQQGHEAKPSTLFRVFCIIAYSSIVIDSFVTGYNTRFSTVRTNSHVLHDSGSQEPMVDLYGQLIKKDPSLQNETPVAFGLGTFIFAVFWSLLKAEGYIDNYMELLPRAYKLLPRAVQSGLDSIGHTMHASRQRLSGCLSAFRYAGGAQSQATNASHLQQVIVSQ